MRRRRRPGTFRRDANTLVILNDPAYGTERSFSGHVLAVHRDRDHKQHRLLADAFTWAFAPSPPDKPRAAQTPLSTWSWPGLVAGAAAGPRRPPSKAPTVSHELTDGRCGPTRSFSAQQ
jgi:hypothetical protein